VVRAAASDDGEWLLAPRPWSGVESWGRNHDHGGGGMTELPLGGGRSVQLLGAR